jgi:hypothetical protein
VSRAGNHFALERKTCPEHPKPHVGIASEGTELKVSATGGPAEGVRHFELERFLKHLFEVATSRQTLYFF